MRPKYTARYDVRFIVCTVSVSWTLDAYCSKCNNRDYQSNWYIYHDHALSTTRGYAEENDEKEKAVNKIYDRRFFGDTISLVVIFLSCMSSCCVNKIVSIFDRMCLQLSDLSKKMEKPCLINA